MFPWATLKVTCRQLPYLPKAASVLCWKVFSGSESLLGPFSEQTKSAGKSMPPGEVLKEGKESTGREISETEVAPIVSKMEISYGEWQSHTTVYFWAVVCERNKIPFYSTLFQSLFFFPPAAYPYLINLAPSLKMRSRHVSFFPSLIFPLCLPRAQHEARNWSHRMSRLQTKYQGAQSIKR